MADIFDQLNLSFQRRNNCVFLMADKIEKHFNFEHFIPHLCEKKVQENIFDMFPNLTDVLQEFPHISTDIQRIFRDHLTKLTQKLSYYFPNDRRVGNEWICDPFSVDLSNVDVVLINLQTQLVELASNGSLQLAFHKTDLSSFWIQTRHGYPELADHATKFLLPFSITYLCESGFSTVTAIKTKKQE